MATESVQPIITPTPVPVPEPVTKKLYAYCTHCGGTGELSLTNADQPPTVTPCSWCNGAGKTEFGEIEV
jgi:hypothetical protein